MLNEGWPEEPEVEIGPDGEEYEKYPNRGIRDIMDEEEVDKEEAEEIWYDGIDQNCDQASDYGTVVGYWPSVAHGPSGGVHGQ